MALNTTDLLTEVRRAGQLPSSGAAMTSADVFGHADRAFTGNLVPLLMRLQEEFFVRRATVSVAAGQSMVPVPRRAMGARVRDVFLVPSAGQRAALVRLRPEQLAEFNPSSSQPQAYYLDAANVVLVPAPSAAVSLEVAYYVRPGRFTVNTSARQIATVTADSPTAGRTAITFSSWTPTTSAMLDVYSYRSPFEPKAVDAVPANFSATGCNFATSDLFAAPVVGDWVAAHEECPVVCLPVEAHALLAQRAAEYALRALGYLEEASSAAGMADKMEADLVAVLTPRTDAQPRRVTGGLMRLIGQGGGGWRW